MEQMFKEWSIRVTSTAPQREPTTSHGQITKNENMLLNSICVTNQKYKKQAIPDRFKFDENTNEFVKVDTIPMMITQVTEKHGDMFDELEHDRIAFKSSMSKNK